MITFVKTQTMSRIIIEATYIEPNVCFECGAPATERHHVVPASLGGTKTIPLCGDCHAKVHRISGQRRNQLGELTKNSLLKRKELIEIQGGFFSRSGRWVTTLGREKGVDMSAANSTSALMSKKRRLEWMQISPAFNYVKQRQDEGATFTQILKELSELYEQSPDKYCTRTGKKVSKGQLSVWLNDLQPIEEQLSNIKDLEKSLDEQQGNEQDLVHSLEICEYVKQLFGSYKTRYLIPLEKIELLNIFLEQANYRKISKVKEWSQLQNRLKLGNIITATTEKIQLLYKLAKMHLKTPIECKIVKRGADNRIIPTNTNVSNADLHSWITFFNGLQKDGVFNIVFDRYNQAVYTFASNEIVEKIITDIDNG